MPSSSRVGLLIPLHGIASRHDLPLPFAYVVVGATVALVLSFLVLIFAWRRPRLVTDRGPRLRAVGRLWGHAWVRWVLRGLVLGLYALAAVAMFAGQDLLTNPTFGFVYVWIWVGLVPVSLVLGQIWRTLNPIRSLHALLTSAAGVDPELGLARLPRWVGVYPAALALFGFAWLELIQPDRATLPVLRVWALVWIFALLIGAIVFGRSWVGAADPFETYATTVSRISWVTATPTGTPRAGNPLRHLMAWQPPPGIAAVVCVLLGSTAFDSFQNTGWWIRTVQLSSDATLFATFGLLAMVLIVWGSFSLACWAMRPFVEGVGLRELPRLMAPSVVPIVIGYAFAHYFSFLVVEGQRTAITFSDPLGRGWNLFGTAELGVNAHLYNHPTAIALIQLFSILGGHVVGIVAAHEKSLTVLRRRSTVIGQVPMLALMICYTSAGLLLLFSP